MEKKRDFTKYMRPSDSPETKEWIQIIADRFPGLVRKTEFHLKFRTVNLYLPSEKIVIDPHTRYKDMGFDAFFQLINDKYPVRRSSIIL